MLHYKLDVARWKVHGSPSFLGEVIIPSLALEIAGAAPAGRLSQRDKSMGCISTDKCSMEKWMTCND